MFLYLNEPQHISEVLRSCTLNEHVRPGVHTLGGCYKVSLNNFQMSKIKKKLTQNFAVKIRVFRSKTIRKIVIYIVIDNRSG